MRQRFGTKLDVYGCFDSPLNAQIDAKTQLNTHFAFKKHPQTPKITRFHKIPHLVMMSREQLVFLKYFLPTDYVAINRHLLLRVGCSYFRDKIKLIADTANLSLLRIFQPFTAFDIFGKSLFSYLFLGVVCICMLQSGSISYQI